MIRLGITGGIGSGKSYISALLRERLNIPVYDCDSEAKRLICQDEAVRQKLIALVGPYLYNKEGELQKSVLADYLFASQQHAAQVNAIVHPAVKDDFCRWSERQITEVVAMESAILYESGMDAVVDKVLFVDAPIELRIQRAMKRDGSTRQQVQARISMQKTEAQLRKAGFVIDNADATGESLLESLQQILQNIAADRQTENTK